MKKLLLVATGGTIASQESTTGGLTAKIDAKGLLGFVPSVLQKYQIDMVQPMNMESSELTPDHWLPMVSAIEQNYDQYDGFIITHGTDTLAYTAAALSYLIQDSAKTIVVTGSQKPIDDEGTDAKKNLLDSFKFAADSNSPGVYVVFGGKAILGTRAKKIRSKNHEAFDSVNYPDVALVDGDNIISHYIPKKPTNPPKFYHQLCDNVLLIKLIPGIRPQDYAKIAGDYAAVIIESYGVGGIPASMLPLITSWDKEGKTVVIGTQVVYEGSDLAIYSVGNAITKNTKTLQTYDMNIEAVVAKIMFILGQTKDAALINKLFYSKIHEDIKTF